MNDNEKLKNIIRKNLDVAASDETYAQMRDSVLEAHGPSKRTESATTLTMTGRIIMRKPIVKLAAVAGVIITVGFGLPYFMGPFRASGTAYGMTDLPGLLSNIRTLHVQSTSWLYEGDPNRPEFEEATVIPCELWLDVPNLRTYFTSFMSWRAPDGRSGLNRVEGVHTAEYAMDIDHTEKTVRFNRVSVVKRRLAVRDQIQRYLHRITEEQLEHFVTVGQETINGILYYIWEREDTDIHLTNTRNRIRCWLAPATGELGRIYIWHRTGDANWRLGWCAENVERDIDIPDSLFAFDAPDDYRYQNTLDTASLGEGLGAGWYSMSGARVCVAVDFTLDDGSVIVGWHSDDLQEDRYQEQGHLFEGLVPGGELPRLPMVVYGLKTVRKESYSPAQTSYVGRHLAYTKKDGWYYEWALFVPSGPLRPTPERRLYRMLCRFNLAEEQAPQTGNPISENRIEADEFDDFVRAAMVELSDDGKAPEHVTHENVLRWAREIRSSLSP